MVNDLKKKVLQIINERGLSSYMNNTKWNNFIKACSNEIPFPPPYTIKYLTEKNLESDTLEKEDVYFIGSWQGDENFPSEDYYFNIEWIKVRPRVLKHIGLLVKPELIDETKEFEEILHKYNIPYEKEGEIYCIYGYR